MAFGGARTAETESRRKIHEQDNRNLLNLRRVCDRAAYLGRSNAADSDLRVVRREGSIAWACDPDATAREHRVSARDDRSIRQDRDQPMTAFGLIVAAPIIGHDIRKGLERVADAITSHRTRNRKHQPPA